MDYIDGEILCFDKPLTWTSFDIVNKVRRELCKKLQIRKLKVGHAGTLDPLATGVVIVCTGKCTHRIEQLMNHTKEYVATLKLGATTPSFDMERPEDATYPTEHISRELIDRVIPTFLGEQWQVPPAFSAVRVEGHRAYDLARRGEQVELKPKLLVIDEIEVLAFDPEQMTLDIRVVCSRGTYIRALARDIGQRLDSGAYLTALRRTRVGDYSLDSAYTMDSFLASIRDLAPAPQTESQSGQTSSDK